MSTYIGIESPEKRCGKTTLLGVLGRLVHRPVVAANISSSAFFRVIQEMQPTLLIDEADTFLRRKSDLRGIFNAGYTRDTAYVMRVTSEKRAANSPRNGRGRPAEGNGSRLAQFSCFCPKVMAAIGRLPETLADRCLIIPMKRKTTEERCERLRDLNATTLRRQCARFVRDHKAEIVRARPILPASLNDRAADVCEPLLVLADLVGGHWPELARQAVTGLSASAEANDSIRPLLLELRVLFAAAGSGRIFSRTLVAELNKRLDRPWANLIRGQAITESWLARQLRTYDIRPRTLRLAGDVAKGYVAADFAEGFQRQVV